MSHYDLTMPVTEQMVRMLHINDTVTLNGTLFGIRDATQIHMFDRGRTTRFDLSGAACIHTAPNVRKVDKSLAYPAGYAPVCVGTTTSARMERFTRPLMKQNGVRILIGKSGLMDESRAAFLELGGAYLAIVGGTAALETTWIEAIEDFGPLLVAMDSHGASLYDAVKQTGIESRQRVLAGLGVKTDAR
jgi:L(+)-tartrate dehydratase beta subunit